MTPGRFGLLAVVALAATLAACGGEAARSASRRPAPTATPLPSVGSLRMVKPPVVIYHDAAGYLDVWVRLNRPIKESDLIPDSYGDRGAFLLALEAEPRYGAAADVRFPTCYSETLEVGDVPAAGTPIDVELTLGPGQGMRAKARLRYATHDTHPAHQLGCPRDRDGHVCSGTVRGKRLAIELGTTYATSCATAREVMTSVGRWANPEACRSNLCVRKHRMNRGFRCDAVFSNGGEGPDAWDIECERGRERITAYA
jgi:hypothetical protein